ncbi:hypothetical protein D0T50_02615 [Bacteroides sp. 214]|uniref:hypothetical protein n=1 Tax=Bacteroides sp. 214 TaxID=2302935 RepID=UPI0013D49213|nr:hypothetical protein [Bacteroides sp. 214]NDW11780.1 hypothetical protein [Bacteroides sp. 214]
MNEEKMVLLSMYPSNGPMDVDKWIQWTHMFCFVDGIAKTVHAKIESEIAKKALLSLHKALFHVDKGFIDVIDALKKDPPEIPPVPINPSPIIPWDDPSALRGIMQIVEAALKELLTILSKHIENPILLKLVHAIGGLINSIEDIIKIFEQEKI